jgi:RNA polymerase sigma-70 factor (ECF subfamily)
LHNSRADRAGIRAITVDERAPGALRRAARRLLKGPGMPNTAEFAAVAWNHRDSLYRLARKWSGNPDDAWDLVQETYERALRSDRSRIPVERMSGWLFVVAKNLFRDHYRRDQRRRLRGRKEAAVMATLYDAATDDDEGDRNGVGLDDVNRALTSLSPALASAWRLHIVEGLSYAEVAARLGVPVATVGTRLLRARRQIREVLSKAQPARGLSAPTRFAASA